jgi:hypothetical protein
LAVTVDVGAMFAGQDTGEVEKERAEDPREVKRLMRCLYLSIG